MAGEPEQISPSYFGDGRTDKGSNVFNLQEYNGSQML